MWYPRPGPAENHIANRGGYDMIRSSPRPTGELSASQWGVPVGRKITPERIFIIFRNALQANYACPGPTILPNNLFRDLTLK